MDRIDAQLFDHTSDGQAVHLFSLTNADGIVAKIINYGGIITSITTPDRYGNQDDIVLGYDSLAEYEACDLYFGCITGRYANRIANGRFILDGISYTLEKNLGEHHLHGAGAGFNKVVWQFATRTDSTSASLVLNYISVDGHGGYPGELSVDVIYTLNDANQLCIDYHASTNKPTVVNLTNHSYFNLRGHQFAGSDGVLGHELLLAAHRYIPTDESGIPLDSFCEVAGTPMDFRDQQRIGARIEEDYRQLRAGYGYDHTWMLNDDRSENTVVATVYEPVSGRTLKVSTTQPGVQFYTANHITERAGKAGVVYQKRGSLCLETQHPGDSPNRCDFPSTVLRPQAPWHERTIYQFECPDCVNVGM